jgi:hypothetical protein
MAVEDVEKETHAHREIADPQKELNITIDRQSRHKSPAERRVVLKQDITIFPLVSIMFFFAYVVSYTSRRLLQGLNVFNGT